MASSLNAKEASAGYGELALVEIPALELLESLGWERGDLMNEVPGPQNPTDRLSWRETVLPARLRAALSKLNPTLQPEALRQAEALADARDSCAALDLDVAAIAAAQKFERLIQAIAVTPNDPAGGEDLDI